MVCEKRNVYTFNEVFFESIFAVCAFWFAVAMVRLYYNYTKRGSRCSLALRCELLLIVIGLVLQCISVVVVVVVCEFLFVEFCFPNDGKFAWMPICVRSHSADIFIIICHPTNDWKSIPYATFYSIFSKINRVSHQHLAAQILFGVMWINVLNLAYSSNMHAFWNTIIFGQPCFDAFWVGRIFADSFQLKMQNQFIGREKCGAYNHTYHVDTINSHLRASNSLWRSLSSYISMSRNTFIMSVTFLLMHPVAVLHTTHHTYTRSDEKYL